MIEKEFIEISKEEKGNYYFETEIHKLNFMYQKHTIIVENELGRTGLRRIMCVLLPELDAPEFRIYTKDHFWRLFNKNATMIKVRCKNKGFKNYLQGKLLELNLEDISKESLFQPEIYS